VIRRRKLLSIVFALTFIGAVGACSSSTKAASTSPTTTGAAGAAGVSAPTASPATTAVATGTPIKVGFVCTCTGPGGQGGFNIVGMDVYKTWANAVNAAGGVAGHPVQLIVKDDMTNPGTALTAVQGFIADHVVAIADLSEIDATFASAVQAANIPVVGIFTVAAPFNTNPDFYPEGQTASALFDSLIATAKASGATSIANMYCAEAPTCALGAPALLAAGKRLGLPDVYNASIAGTAPNYTAQCVAAQQAGAKSLWIADAGEVITRVAADGGRQGYTPINVLEGEVFGMNLTEIPQFKNNLWAEFPDLPFFANTPAVQQFNAAIDKYYPGLRENPNKLTQDSFMAWTSGKLLEDAIKAGGLTPSDMPSAAEVKKGLESLKGDTVGGLTPPLTFSSGQPHHDNCWFTARVMNGVPQVQNNGQVTCNP
jgi:branched-chain amino acid transport system substrate-binding protein